MEAFITYIPTAVVTLILGIIAQRVVRAGKKDETEVQRAANRLAETQQALDAQEKYIERLIADNAREHTYRVEAETAEREAKARERALHLLVVGQIEAAAATAFPPEPQPTNRERFSEE